MNHPYPTRYATPMPRGCGKRKAGKLYLECGVSPVGTSPEQLMYDPAQILKPGMDLVNKAQVFPRMREVRDPGTNVVIAEEAVYDPISGKPLYDVYIYIGKEHYPSVADFVEEAREGGISRCVPASLKVDLLTRASYMFLVHPCARIRDWQLLQPPRVCRREQAGHDLVWFVAHELNHETQREEWNGPCVFKAWEVIPKEEACEVVHVEGLEPMYSRRIKGTTLTYSYFPTGEVVPKDGWEAGIFMRVQLTGAALVRTADEYLEREQEDSEDEEVGTVKGKEDDEDEVLQKEAIAKRVNVRAYHRLMKGVKEHGEAMALPFYETDR